MAAKKVSRSAPKAEQKRADTTNAVISLVLGIIGVLVPLIGFILGVLAIIFYVRQRKAGPSGMATAGLVLGIVAIAVNLLLISILAAVFYFFAHSQEAFLSNQCVTRYPFRCADLESSEGNVSFVLVNEGGAELTNVTATVLCGNRREQRVAAGNLASGANFTVNASCPSFTYGVRELEYTVDYTRDGSHGTAPGHLFIRMDRLPPVQYG